MADMDFSRMDQIQNVSVPELAGLGRAAPQASCAPHVHSCGELVTEDRAVTAVLHEYLTQVRQGIAAYREIARSSVRVYRNGQSLTEQEFRSRFSQAASGLPRYDPTLDDPKPQEQGPTA